MIVHRGLGYPGTWPSARADGINVPRYTYSGLCYWLYVSVRQLRMGKVYQGTYALDMAPHPSYCNHQKNSIINAHDAITSVIPSFNLPEDTALQYTSYRIY